MLDILQIIISILLIAAILIQERGGGISGIFGGREFAPYQTRRGLEKVVFYITIFLAILLGILSILNLQK
jgi:preprotein translocase subunit SecG